MADTNHRTVASITREGRGPQPHAYDDPDLSPIEFLQAVYRDPRLPMSPRIDAARGLLPYTEPRPANAVLSGCTIVIPPLSYEPWSHICSPWPRERGSADDPTRNHSQNPDFAHKTLTHNLEAVDPVNIETTSYPQSLGLFHSPNPHRAPTNSRHDPPSSPRSRTSPYRKTSPLSLWPLDHR